MSPMILTSLLLGALLVPQRPSAPSTAQTAALSSTIDKAAAAVEQDMLGWRRHLHQHPELSNREVETAKYVADKLRSFGLEPRC